MTLNIQFSHLGFDQSQPRSVQGGTMEASPPGPRLAEPFSDRAERFSAASFQYTFAAQTNHLRLSIQTTDGDVVTVELRQGGFRETSALAMANPSGKGIALDEKRHSESYLDYTVIGNLNDKEQKAIQKLIGKIERVADRFFAGNVASALRQVGRLGFNASQIAGFALSLEYERSFQAVTAYHQTGGRPQLADVNKAVDFARELQDLPNRDLAFLQKPAAAAGELMVGITQMKASQLDHPVEVEVLEQLQQLVQIAFDRYELPETGGPVPGGEARDLN